MVSFVQWAEKLTEISIAALLVLIGISCNRYYDWLARFGKPNKHNGLIPKDTWLTPAEKKAILSYHALNPLNGYRRLCYMMMDEDIVHCSPNSVYRTLKEAGVLDHRPPKGGCKGKGFQQPTLVNEHWHVDVSYLNICGTFYYLCSILDGYSRYIVHHEIREAMKEEDVQVIIQRGLEISVRTLIDQGFTKAEAKKLVAPRIISDNGPQFIAKDFKLFIKLAGMTHVKTSPYYPESNGKIERWHREMKTTYRSKEVNSLDEARGVVAGFVDEYNHLKLHSAIGYTTPLDRYLGLDIGLQAQRKDKLGKASERRAQYWKAIEAEKRAKTHSDFRESLRPTDANPV